MNSKRKTKLVCVGWGVIWMYNRTRPTLDRKTGRQRTRSIAIRIFNQYLVNGSYESFRCRGLAIAKKLWVEVEYGKL